MNENKIKLTELSELGEFMLINKLTENNKTVNKSTIKTIGDDAAIVIYDSEFQTVITLSLIHI